MYINKGICIAKALAVRAYQFIQIANIIIIEIGKEKKDTCYGVQYPVICN